MNTPSVCPQVVLTIQVSETLFAALEVTAEMERTTVRAVVVTALKEKAIGKPPSRAIPAPQPGRRACGEPVIGSLQQAILDRLDAAAAPSGVVDLSPIRRDLAGYSKNSVSRVISRLVRGGILELVRWSGDGFIAADSEAQIRFARAQMKNPPVARRAFYSTRTAMDHTAMTADSSDMRFVRRTEKLKLTGCLQMFAQNPVSPENAL